MFSAWYMFGNPHLKCNKPGIIRTNKNTVLHAIRVTGARYDVYTYKRERVGRHKWNTSWHFKETTYSIVGTTLADWRPITHTEASFKGLPVNKADVIRELERDPAFLRKQARVWLATPTPVEMTAAQRCIIIDMRRNTAKKKKEAPRLPESLGPDAITSMTRRGYGIEKSSIDPSVLEALKTYLTVSPAVNPMVAQAGPPPRYPVYQQSRSKIYIPKYLGLSVYGMPTEDKTAEPVPLGCSFAGSLRDTQRAPVDAFLEAARDPRRRGGIINMACAAGKTVMAVYITCALGVKTLVLVHKEFLARQWEERINQFSPDAKVGRIQGSVFDVEGRDIVIAMVQTLSVRNFDDDAFDGFGLVIADECHHMSAEVFSRSLHRVNFRYALGLSATLQRSDGLSHVFQWFLGGVCYKTNRPRETVEVVVMEYSSADPKYREESFVFGKQINMARMISNVCGHQPRTKAVAQRVVASLEERPGSKVLILSERRTHLMELDAAVRDIADVSTGFYVGGMKQEALKESEGKQVVFGTFAMASEGMDIPALDTLVLASPKSEIEQAVGRILRVKADERERVPRVIDVVDGFSVFTAQAAKRARYYRKCGYTIVKS